MALIDKDEMYNWTPGSFSGGREIPDGLNKELEDAVERYNAVCEQIDEYLLSKIG
jgi:hypothetical protein